ncbi:MAG TPA: ABC transporter ATP-binding protein [Solirubrobacteraceae bacterium]|nr:ABC transporter ATP-binding protein [Solirubrobacteraceae bacterium]
MARVDTDALPPIVVDGVSKTFRVPEERTHTFKERALHPLRRSGHDAFRALRDISFVVEPGEFFGIVGRNGSGKSTLLKCLAGIYAVDSGRIWCRGRMSPFIELGVGFNPDLAALDNVVMNGIMLGLTPKEARDRYEEVIAFAELEEFQDLKLKNYSSGMHVRLAFSVAIQVDADILLIDEVLAVGDAAFQQKCFDVFNRLRDEGRTIVFVTHDMGSVNRFCHRAMLLERGDMVAIGDPHEVADQYLALNFDREGAADAPESEEHLAKEWAGSHEARILEAWIEDISGARLNACQQGERVRFKAAVTFDTSLEDPAFSVEIEDEWGTKIFTATTAVENERSGSFAAGEEVVFCVDFENHLAPGKYYPTVNVARRGGGLDVIHRVRRMSTITVFGSTAQGGVVDLPYVASVEREARAIELSRG